MGEEIRCFGFGYRLSEGFRNHFFRNRVVFSAEVLNHRLHGQWALMLKRDDVHLSFLSLISHSYYTARNEKKTHRPAPFFNCIGEVRTLGAHHRFVDLRGVGATVDLQVRVLVTREEPVRTTSKRQVSGKLA